MVILVFVSFCKLVEILKVCFVLWCILLIFLVVNILILVSVVIIIVEVIVVVLFFLVVIIKGKLWWLILVMLCFLWFSNLIFFLFNFIFIMLLIMVIVVGIVFCLWIVFLILIVVWVFCGNGILWEIMVDFSVIIGFLFFKVFCIFGEICNNLGEIFNLDILCFLLMI